MIRINNLEINNTKFDAIIIENGDSPRAIKRENGITSDNSSTLYVKDDYPHLFADIYAIFQAHGVDTTTMRGWIEIYSN